MRTFFTHDNGGRPFMVEVDQPIVKVFKLPDNFPYNRRAKNSEYTVMVKKFETSKVYIGKSPKTPMTEFSGGHGPKFNGNSILLQLKNGNMVFIGDNIYKFEMEKDDIIKTYVSPVGNNDVPYPTAIGRNNIYFMLDQKYVPVKYLPKALTKSDMNDLYSIFYGHVQPYPPLEPYAKKMKGLKIIHTRV